MSTVDPAVERARREQRQRDRKGSLPRLLAAAAGCLVTGYLFGRGLAGIVAALLWSAAQDASELSTSQMPPYWSGLGAGGVGVGMLLWYRSESRRFTGVPGLPAVGLSLAVAAVAGGVWWQGLRWAGPDYYWSDGVRYQAKEHEYWLVEHSGWWLPIVCVGLAGLIPASSIWRSRRRKAKSEWAQHLRDSGRRARGVVTEATSTGGETDGRKLVHFTVKFTDHAGVERWVSDRAHFVPAAIPSAGNKATVFFDPDHLVPEKIVVALEPLRATEQKMYERAAGPADPRRTSAGRDAGSSPSWGSPSDDLHHGDAGHGSFRGDA